MTRIISSIRILVFLTAIAATQADVCASHCQSIDSCKTDPRARGSYCRTDKNPHICHGIYFTDASKTRMCYRPNDAKCPESIPVGCGAETTAAPHAKAHHAAKASPAVATTAAPARKVPVAPVVVPNGKYTASGAFFSLSVTFDAKAMTGAIELSVAGRKIHGSHIPFVMHGSVVRCSSGPALTGFLAQLPFAVSADDLVMTYDAAADQVIGSIMGFSVTGKK